MTPAGAPADIRRLSARILLAGLVLALLVGVLGLALERVRYGPGGDAAFTRVEAEVRQRLADSTDTLDAVAAAIRAEGPLVADAQQDTASVGRLFDVLDTQIPERLRSSLGVTVYGSTGQPLAWSGRVSAISEDDLARADSLFVESGELGPRMVRVESIPPQDGAARPGAIVVEQLLADVRIPPDFGDTFPVATTVAPAFHKTSADDDTDSNTHTFTIFSSAGSALAEFTVRAADVAASREIWRRKVVGSSLAISGLTLLLLAASIVELRRRARSARDLLAETARVAAAVGGGCALVWLASRSAITDPATSRTLSSAVGAALSASVVWLTFDLVERWRHERPSKLLPVSSAVAAYVAAGLAASVLLWIYADVLPRLAGQPGADMLRLTLAPGDATRISLAASLLVLHVAVVWLTAVMLRLVAVAARTERGFLARAVVPWSGGVLLATLVLAGVPSSVPVPALYPSLAAAALCAWAITKPRWRARRTSQAARLGARFAALLVPALSLYPILHALTVRSTEEQIAQVFGPRALHLRDDLQNSLRSALEAIDSAPSLGRFVAADGNRSVTTDQTFALWSTTDLARQRLTSAVELYSADGRLASRFALNLPEYAATTHIAASCEWDLFDEVSPFGSSERHVLRASRGICENNRRLGTVVVRAMLDYRTLPFIVSESPYLESMRSTALSAPAAAPALEFVVYGWSRAPIYVSGTSVWPLPDEVFDAMVASREPSWASVRRGNRLFRVHFANDRGGIYALGYPTTTPFGHLVNLAELATLSGVVFLLMIGATTAFKVATSRSPASGRDLWREVRASFYRKLFLALLAAAVVPVIVLAVATRTYFAAQFRAGIEESAMQTATVAQRLVEDYATLQELGNRSLEGLDDQIMVLVARAIDQAVNLFDRDALQATSERDLFASGLLPTRTPAAVYRAIVVDRLPAFVGEEEVGGLPYLVAAAPARAGTREGIVTVPQTLRRQQIELQIDELDRRVLFASVLFVLMGAGIGYWMAERIADPVRRLTRATRRIALGDLDARIAGTSSDELRRLVEDFNRMAADLKRQRSELERTQRLEAWAQMARQVAHDIKNPLTPIQLSAEHARRVNVDRGRPLSPVLDECIDAILGQVKLLRQISAEFSSFASSPTPRPEPTDLNAVIEQVVAPYRTGLGERVIIEHRGPDVLPQVHIDRTLFARALTNVVENALHAMPGGGRLTITVAADRLDWLEVRVVDTGVGMDEESVARIFEPYFSTKATGTGLGLTIAKRNIELNGGTIAIASTPGVGTTVTIAVPVEGGEPA